MEVRTFAANGRTWQHPETTDLWHLPGKEQARTDKASVRDSGVAETHLKSCSAA